MSRTHYLQTAHYMWKWASCSRLPFEKEVSCCLASVTECWRLRFMQTEVCAANCQCQCLGMQAATGVSDAYRAHRQSCQVPVSGGRRGDSCRGAGESTAARCCCSRSRCSRSHCRAGGGQHRQVRAGASAHFQPGAAAPQGCRLMLPSVLCLQRIYLPCAGQEDQFT